MHFSLRKNLNKTFSNTSLVLFFLFLIIISPLQESFAACGGTTITWDAGGGNVRWHTVANWNPDNEPDVSTEDVVIVSANKIARMTRSRTIGCLEVQSGVLDARAGNTTVTITGDYFRNLTQNSLTIQASDSHTFDMAGTAAQTFENVDPVNTLVISNDSTVTFTNSFTIRNALNLTGSSTILKIQGDLTLEAASTTLSIPSGVTVEVESGVTLTASEGITVNGTLIIKEGATVVIGNAKTVQVNSGGVLQLNGTSGNTSTLRGDGAGNNFTLNVAGQITADYFRIDRLDANGLNVTGTISSMDNGEFHFLANSGFAMTLGAASTIPSTFDTIGFFDDDGHGNVGNIDASSYAGASTTFNNWSGSIGGEGNDTDPNCGGDPPGCVAWGAQAGTKLNLSDNTAGGFPPATIAESSADTLFATFAFSLNQSSTTTDITDVKLTMTGTASSSDISNVKVFKDAGAGTSCAYDSGTDTQLGSDLTLSGSPPEASISISAGEIQTSSDTDVVCIHVLTATTSTAQDGTTIKFAISSTADVTNSEGYSFSDTAGPPVTAGESTITTTITLNTWQGDVDDRFNRGGNWLSSGFPNSGKDCKIGSGLNPTRVGNTTTVACRNATLQTGGNVDFDNTTNVFEVYGSLDVQSGFTFTDAGSGVFTMAGSDNQSLSLGTDFPGNMIINNTGSSGSDTVSVNGNSTIQGNLTITNGTLRIADGKTLTVEGNITVQTGAVLDVDPGATLILANGSSLTVDSGGQLTLVGTAAKTAKVTSTSSANAYTVTINGTIAARFYTFENLGTNGVTINSGASIDSTNHLQNGTFSHPVNSGSTFLTLNRKVPTDSMNDCSFNLDGSAATGTVSLDLSGIATTPQTTLTLDNYSGDVSGPGTQVDGANYVASWTGATNTLDLTQEATSPATLNAGTTYNMGRFGFQQTQAGASFSDADITSLKLTLTGNGSSSDVDEARVFYDSDCDSSAGTLIGSGTFSGSPGNKTFSFSAGDATIEADVSSPPLRCIYVEFDIASGASDGKTLGVQIAASTDVVNDQSYSISGSTAPPLNLGNPGNIVGSSTTIWTGTTDTDWFTASNWSAGIPDSGKDCEIDNVANDPVINGGSGTAICKSVTIGSGILTLQNSTSAVLEVHGNYANTGTLNQNDGTLRLEGSADQNISSNTTIDSLTFDKTGGGIVQATSSSMTITNLTIPGGSNFEFRVQSGKTLVLPNGLSLPAGTFNIQGGATLEIGSSQNILVTGGTFKTSGTNDAFTQSTSNKGTITRQGASGTWGFNASSGSVDLVGFLIDRIDTSGLQITGTADLINFDGGQFTNLTNSASTRALQLNTSTNITEATATNIGWNWDAANSTFASSCCKPDPTDTYFLVHASACGSGTLTFDQWFGDFWPGSPSDLDTEDKIQDADDGGSTCQVTIAASASPVSLLSLSATGYNGAVTVDWVTGSENNHAGFNVYRSESLLGGYIQVNAELIRNFKNSTNFQGTYRYTDNDVDNGKSYFYYIEDIAFNGTAVLHGPVAAFPNAAAGAAPSADAGANEETSETGTEVGNDPVQGPVNNPILTDLGNGVHIIAKTHNSIRLEVIPPAASYTIASWDASFKDANIAGYTKTTTEGHPELLERVLMIEVDGSPASAQVSSETIEENAVVNHKLQPAPTWTLNGSNVLVPTYTVDSAVYAQNQVSPAAYYNLTTSIQKIGIRSYLKIKINPLRYNPVTEDVSSLKKLVLDIGLDGQAWDVSTPTGTLTSTPSAVEGSLRIKYQKTGMYELSYDDIDSAGLIGPFDSIDVDDLRMYFRGTEIPIEVVSGDSTFDSGDAIRYYAERYRHHEDDEDEVVLTTFDLNGNGSALRIENLDANPSGVTDSSSQETFRRQKAEQDNDAILDRPYGDLVDRFVWKFLFAQKGVAPGAAANLDVNIDLPGLINDVNKVVRIKLYVRGKGAFAVNPTHHIGIFVNSSATMLDSQTFSENDQPVQLTFEIPANEFFAGTNSLRIQAQGDKVPDGDFDLINIDRLEVEYASFYEADNDVLTIEKPELDHVVTASNFSGSDIAVYDVSDQEFVSKLSNVSITTPDSGASFEAEFKVSAGSSGDLGYRIHALKETTYLKPTGIFLGRGYALPLLSTAQGADLIMIGHESLLRAADRLVAHRELQGLRVKQVDIQQIYAEFSHGVKSSQAIRDFLLYAHGQWQTPKPQYVLILGDATFDPRDRFGYGIAKDYMPIPMERGQFEDFGNDNWFVTDKNDSSMPLMSIGRLPSNSEADIENFVSKLIDYENGQKSPSKEQSRKMVYIADKSPLGEKFTEQSQQLSLGMASLKASVSSQKLDRNNLSDADLNTAIANAFSTSPLLMTYIGHGAEDRWADSDVFSLSHARALNNEKLPIVMALNCLNSRFYQDDPDAKSLAEELVFNENGGSVAFWGSTSMTAPSVQVNLQQAFQEELAQATSQHLNQFRIGDFMMSAKVKLGESTSTKDTIRSWTLIGDPSMKLSDVVYADPPPASEVDGSRDLSSESDDGGSFMNCGSIKPPTSGGSRAWIEVLLLGLFLMLSRQVLRRV